MLIFEDRLGRRVYYIRMYTTLPFGFTLSIHRERDSARARLYRDDRAVFGIEVGARGFHVGASVTIEPDDEAPIRGKVGLGPLVAYLSSEAHGAQRLAMTIGRYLKKDFYKRPSGKFGIELFTIDGAVILRADAGTAADGRDGRPLLYLDLKDAIAGRTVYSSADEPPVTRTVHFAEGAYDLTLVRSKRAWTRPRWPWPTRGTYIEMTAVAGPGGRTCIPVPGKGESGWDLDEDGITGMSFRCSDFDEAAGQTVGAVMRRRARYGGKSWTPGQRPVPAGDPPPPAVAA